MTSQPGCDQTPQRRPATVQSMAGRTAHAGDPLDELEMHAWRAFFVMHDQVRARVERQLQADAGLSLADYSVLGVLSEAASRRRRMFELCQDLRWEKSRLHHQLARMGRRGLVSRHTDEGSPASRGVNVELTEAGLAAIVDAAPAHAREVRRVLIDHLTRRQLQQLADIAIRIIEANCADSPETV